MFFDGGDGCHPDFVVEAFLAYWLSWYVFPSGSQDEINIYIFLWQS